MILQAADLAPIEKPISLGGTDFFGFQVFQLHGGLPAHFRPKYRIWLHNI